MISLFWSRSSPFADVDDPPLPILSKEPESHETCRRSGAGVETIGYRATFETGEMNTAWEDRFLSMPRLFTSALT